MAWPRSKLGSGDLEEMLQYLRGMRGHGRGGRRVQQSERQTRNQEHGRVYHHFLARAMCDLLPSSLLAVVIVKRDETFEAPLGSRDHETR
jgi:hypothetical protein